jgi:hypothetical protein
MATNFSQMHAAWNDLLSVSAPNGPAAQAAAAAAATVATEAAAEAVPSRSSGGGLRTQLDPEAMLLFSEISDSFEITALRAAQVSGLQVQPVQTVF